MSKNGQHLETKYTDLNRLRDEYADRKCRLATSNFYSVFNVSYLYAVQQQKRDSLNLLQRHGSNSLDGAIILELGCVYGGVLLYYLIYGVGSKDLHGCDLLPDRLYQAQTRFPHLPLSCADGQVLPYPTNTFNFLLQNTVLSSILDIVIKINLVREMLRVLKPGGMILWYAFWLCPTNPNTKGIRKKKSFENNAQNAHLNSI